MTIPPDLVARLPASVARALPDWDGAAAAIEGIAERPRATLIRSTVTVDSRTMRLFIKIPRLIDRPPSDRPRLVPDTPAREKMLLEAGTLGLIHADLEAIPDPRFGAVRVIDVYEDLGAMVMTEAPGVPLANHLSRAVGPSRDARARSRLAPALSHAGAWLRRFQGLTGDTERAARLSTRSDVVDLTRGIGDYLGARTTRHEVVRAAVERVVASADATLPSALPLGLSHGDFAVRNLLVDGAGAVTVIDALGRWRMPIYDDLARMRVGIATSRIQSATFGRAIDAWHRAQLDDALLSGYGRDALDPAAVRLYSILILLDKWAAAVERRHAARRRLRRVPDRLIDGHYARVARSILAPPNAEPR